MSEQVWRVAGRYRVLGRIGSGGMADVVRAHDELLDRDVAVKVFRSVPTTPDTATGVERQHAELRALARLNHPNLTVLYDGSIVGQDGPAYLVMELIAGGSLAEAIADGGLGVDHTAEVGAQVADALAYVHTAGMVHRDVKPANILLGDDRIADTDFGRARLTDFGIVRLIGDEPLTQADMTLGSASYLAPEQTRGSGVGPPADIYALGLSLLEALTGRRSFEGPPLEAALARLSNDPHIPSDLPQPWPGLLTAMTARDPAVRPTAGQVAKAMRNTDTTAAALTALPVPMPIPDGSADTTSYLPRSAAVGSTTALPPARPPVGPAPPVRVARPPEEPPRPERRVPLWVAILAAVVLLLLVVGGILLATSGGSGGGGAGSSTATPTPTPTPSTSAPASTSSAPRTESAPSTEDSAPASDTQAPSSDASSAPSSAPSTRSSSTSPTSSSANTSSSAASSSASSTAAAEGPGAPSSSGSTSAKPGTG